MSGSDDHEVVLRWPHTDADEVYVTGTFDQWSSSIRLARKASGFEAPVRIPWQDKVQYKFIVDGRWVTNDAEPTESEHGFVNNVYTAPSKPAPPKVDVPPAVIAPEPEPKSLSEPEPTPEADKPTRNGSIVSVVGGTVSDLAGHLHSAVVAPAVAFATSFDTAYGAPTPATDESAPSFVEEVKDAVAPVAPKAQEEVAAVVPSAKEEESKPSDGSDVRDQPLPEPVALEKPEMAPTVPVPILPAYTMPSPAPAPESEVVASTTTAPNPPVEGAPAERVPIHVERSTHVLLRFGEPKPEVATDAGTGVVETAATDIPVIDVTSAPTDEAVPEPAPAALAAEPVTEDAALKELAPAEPVAAVETAAAPVAVVEVHGPAEEVVEDNVEVPEALAAPPVAGEEVKEVVSEEETKVSEVLPEVQAETKEPEVVAEAIRAVVEPAVAAQPIAMELISAEPSPAEPIPAEPTPEHAAIPAEAESEHIQETTPEAPASKSEVSPAEPCPAHTDAIAAAAVTEVSPAEPCPTFKEETPAEPAVVAPEPAVEPGPAEDAPPAEPTPASPTVNGLAAVEEAKVAEPEPAPAVVEEPVINGNGQAEEPKTSEPEPAAPAVGEAKLEEPKTNGTPAAEPASAAAETNGTVKSKQSLSSTPSKSKRFSFPGKGEASESPSGSSRFSSTQTRAKRTSLFGKLKDIFGNDKKEKKKAAK